MTTHRWFILNHVWVWYGWSQEHLGLKLFYNATASMRLPAQLREHTAFWSRAWGSSWNLHAVLSSCSETAGLPQSSSLLSAYLHTASAEVQWHLHPGSLHRCTGEVPKYPTQRPVQLSSTKSFSDKNLLVGVSLSNSLLARIRGDLCSALTLEQLPQLLWIRCQIRREPSSARHETGSDEQSPTPAQLMVGQRGRHWHHSFAPRITSHCSQSSLLHGRQDSYYITWGF